mmetsp:Transcript_14675/g.31043  ORF Transcript_14675/g.31043 Transcript_14675/m.31043 type:complete len:608 (-) Transcript_14675:441-2264(-)
MTSDILKSADEAARIASATVSKSSTYPASNSSFDSQNAHPPRASADARATAAPCQDRIGRAPGAAKTSRSKEAHGAKTRLQPHLQRVAAMAPPPSRHNPAEAARVVASAPARNAPPESQQPRNAHAANSATYAVAPLQFQTSRDGSSPDDLYVDYDNLDSPRGGGASESDLGERIGLQEPNWEAEAHSARSEESPSVISESQGSAAGRSAFSASSAALSAITGTTAISCREALAALKVLAADMQASESKHGRQSGGLSSSSTAAAAAAYLAAANTAAAVASATASATAIANAAAAEYGYGDPQMWEYGPIPGRPAYYPSCPARDRKAETDSFTLARFGTPSAHASESTPHITNHRRSLSTPDHNSCLGLGATAPARISDGTASKRSSEPSMQPERQVGATFPPPLYTSSSSMLVSPRAPAKAQDPPQSPKGSPMHNQHGRSKANSLTSALSLALTGGSRSKAERSPSMPDSDTRGSAHNGGKIQNSTATASRARTSRLSTAVTLSRSSSKSLLAGDQSTDIRTGVPVAPSLRGVPLPPVPDGMPPIPAFGKTWPATKEESEELASLEATCSCSRTSEFSNMSDATARPSDVAKFHFKSINEQLAGLY